MNGEWDCVMGHFLSVGCFESGTFHVGTFCICIGFGLFVLLFH